MLVLCNHDFRFQITAMDTVVRVAVPVVAATAAGTVAVVAAPAVLG